MDDEWSALLDVLRDGDGGSSAAVLRRVLFPLLLAVRRLGAVVAVVDVVAAVVERRPPPSLCRRCPLLLLLPLKASWRRRTSRAAFRALATAKASVSRVRPVHQAAAAKDSASQQALPGGLADRAVARRRNAFC